MRKYETVFIADPDLQDKVRIDLYEKARNIIAKEGGILTGFDEWGNKKLAYEIKKKLRGNYVCIT
ncbi:MAG: 30S ribosomal protein S6, partial [Desulfobacula sp.]|uniref:30S ribosomal protein S6 n=1 Tax=Desulfobacula sp. TaxID=2593537 RepID=UPI001ECC1B9D|nr:30S ribosomal protein S6 [Desulfobacula sp.]